MFESEHFKKQVGLLDENDKIVSIFTGVMEAARILELDSSAISKVCRGKLKSTKGFRFQYII